ncbi:MAG: MBL fold metallo-hydrolase [Calditrichia bacterium]
MKIHFLGTGTSMGIPMLGCQCAVCKSSDPKDKRLRTSVWIQKNNCSLIIDAGVDFRQQALLAGIRRVDAVLFTHHHVDHIFGLDDLRPLGILQNRAVEIYASPETFRNLQRVYAYLFDENPAQSDIPRVNWNLIENGCFQINDDLEVLPILLYHGKLPVLGYRIGDFAYCTDVSHIPEESFARLDSLKILVLGALRHSSHATHFNIKQAVEAAQKIGAEQTWFIHMSHQVAHQQTNEQLPAGIRLAYDGLEINL